MSLIRLIVIGLIIYLLLQIFKRWSANKNSQVSKQQNEQSQMVCCDICQLHVPENEALQKNGKFYCSQDHFDKAL